MAQSIDQIVEKINQGVRLSPEDGLALWHDAPLWLLSKLATQSKVKHSGDKVFYNRNIHIEPTNWCIFNCKFCSYRRNGEAPDMWDHSMEEVLQIARSHADKGLTEVHIVGGVHPHHDLYYYAEMIAQIHAIMPTATIKAFTAVELSHYIRTAGLSIHDGLKLLIDAGMEAIPGGGAEIFDPTIRNQICPDKGSTEEWFEVHDCAHKLGIKTNATILYGHIESIEERIDHLDRLRVQQDSTKGFNAFIPLKFRAKGNSMSHLGEVSILEDLRMLALSRLYLDNFDHIKAYWVMYGKQTAEMALHFGADDLDGTIDDSTKIYSMAGAEEQRPAITIREIETMAVQAGFRAVERDTNYNTIE